MSRVGTQLTGAAAASCRCHHQRHSSFLSRSQGNPRVSQRDPRPPGKWGIHSDRPRGSRKLGGPRRLPQRGEEGTPSLPARAPFLNLVWCGGKHSEKAGDGVGPVGCSGCNIWTLFAAKLTASRIWATSSPPLWVGMTVSRGTAAL